MADVLKDILQYLYDDMTAEMAVSGQFEYIAAHFMTTPLAFPPEMSTPAPFTLIYPGEVPLSIKDLGVWNVHSTPQITFSTFLENYTINEGLLGNSTAGTKGAIEIADDFVTRYHDNLLGGLIVNVHSVKKSFRQIAMPQFLGSSQQNLLFQCHVIFEYYYIDRRAS